MAEYIEREALKELIRKHFKMAIDANLYSMDTVAASCAVISLINGAEKAEVEPVRRGIWTKSEDDWGSMAAITCSECHEEWCFETEDDVSLLNYRYCPNCGARCDLGGAENEM